MRLNPTSGGPCAQYITHSMTVYKYKYVFRTVGCFRGPYLANSFNRSTHNAKQYSSQLFRGGTSSSTVMAAVVGAIAHVLYQRKKAYSLAEQCLIIICRGFVFFKWEQ